MEFGDDAEDREPSEEVGLAARLAKKTKTQTKEKGEVYLILLQCTGNMVR